MASSSRTVAGSCSYCKCSSPQLMNGWPLRSGGYAQLCKQCAEAYHDGTFCSIFHSGVAGWRDCNDCGMYLHCGCIMSAHLYEEWDLGGVICKTCLHKFYRSMGLDGSPTASDLNVDPEDLENSEDPLEVDLNVEPNMVVGAGNEEPHESNKEIVQVPQHDTDKKLGRLLVPKTQALAHFPKIDEPQGFPLQVRDETGRQWDFHYHYWQNAKSNIYVLAGLKDYMMLNDWQAGDMVEFYRIEPEGMLLIYTRKLAMHLPPARPPPPPN